MLKWFSHNNNIPASDIDELRNEAVAAWIKTFPVEDRLQTFLSSVPDPVRQSVSASAKAIFDAATAYLEEAANAGIINIKDFYSALEFHLKSRFPWMREPAFAALRSYTGWYAWREGYTPTEPTDNLNGGIRGGSADP
jgi:hypothetical protein